jgi:RNA polymerase sigma-70 factor (ECF subfamily)
MPPVKQGAGALTDPRAIERFTALYDEHHRSVYAYAVSKAGRQIADEVVAEVFLVAWRRLAGVLESELPEPILPEPILPEPILPWLLAVARNVAIGQFRVAARQQSLAAELRAWSSGGGLGAPVTGDVADQVSERQAALRALASLSEADRELLTLVAWHGLSAREAAGVVGCSTATYFVRLHRARNRLERAMEGPLEADHIDGLGTALVPSKGR